MDQTLGKEIPAGRERRQFLQDNCDRAETKSYYKKFSTEKLQEFKEKLSDYSIKISDLIECRPMLPEERQANMFAIEEYKKTGTN